MTAGQSIVEYPSNHLRSKVYYSVFGCKLKACHDPELNFHYFHERGKSKVNHNSKLGITELIDKEDCCGATNDTKEDLAHGSLCHKI